MTEKCHAVVIQLYSLVTLRLHGCPVLQLDINKRWQMMLQNFPFYGGCGVNKNNVVCLTVQHYDNVCVCIKCVFNHI